MSSVGMRAYVYVSLYTSRERYKITGSIGLKVDIYSFFTLELHKIAFDKQTNKQNRQNIKEKQNLKTIILVCSIVFFYLQLLSI